MESIHIQKPHSYATYLYSCIYSHVDEVSLQYENTLRGEIVSSLTENLKYATTDSRFQIRTDGDFFIFNIKRALPVFDDDILYLIVQSKSIFVRHKKTLLEELNTLWWYIFYCTLFCYSTEHCFCSLIIFSWNMNHNVVMHLFFIYGWTTRPNLLRETLHL